MIEKQEKYSGDIIHRNVNDVIYVDMSSGDNYHVTKLALRWR